MSFCEHFNSSNCSLLKYVLIPTSDIPNIRCQMFCQIDISDIICPSPTFVPTAVLLLTFLELSDIICPDVLLQHLFSYMSTQIDIPGSSKLSDIICPSPTFVPTQIDTPGFGDVVDNSNCWQPITGGYKILDLLNCLEFKIQKRF